MSLDINTTRRFSALRFSAALAAMTLTAVFTPIGASAADEGAAAAINKPAPDFTLPGASGKTVTLSQLKGKTVVLEWLNHDCPFVKKHYNSMNMQKLQDAYAAKGVTWLSINSSAPGKQGHLTVADANTISAEKKSRASDLLFDESGAVGKKYGAKTTPHMYVIDKDGVLRYMGAIDDSASTRQDDIPESKNFVSAALDAVLAGKTVEPQVTEAYGCSIKYAS